MRIVAWGSYDSGKPRTRILLRGLEENGVELIECHAHVWKGIEDKSRLKGFSRLLALLRWLFSYPALIGRYLFLPTHEAVFIGYLGHLDVLVLWPFAKMRGVPIVWDSFLSLYDTVVEDRKFMKPQNPLARLLFFFEKLSCHAADLVLLDTRSHADYFVENFRLPASRVKHVFVGAEPEFFSPKKKNCVEKNPLSKMTVLFYGQMIPLHGIQTVIEAARLAKDENIHWRIIGKGQQAHLLEKTCLDGSLPKLEWIPWVSYDRLITEIQAADICLGIFGDTDKAARVIPNKVFQILCSGSRLVTRDSPAIRELVSAEDAGIMLVPPADAGAILAAIHELAERPPPWPQPLHRHIIPEIMPVSIGRDLIGLIDEYRKHAKT